MRPSWVRWKTRDSDAPPRTPSLRQIQETECGVIALAIVLAHHDAWVPLPELRRRCEVSGQGVTALSLVQAGKHYGLTIRAMRLPANALRHIQAPVILFWENWHFVVLEGISDTLAWVNDPARGHRRLSMAQFKSGYSGVALIAQPGADFHPIGSPRQPFRVAADMLRPGRWWLALMGTAALAESVALPLAIRRTGDAIDDAWAGRTAGRRSVAPALIGLLIASALRHWLTGVALDAIATPVRRRLAHNPAAAPSPYTLEQPTARLGQHALADYPATTAVRIVTAGIRMTVAAPLLVLAIGRIHPVAAFVALASLATPLLMQQPTVRSAASAPPSGAPGDASSWRWLETRWPNLRPFMDVSPVIAVGVLTTTDRMPAMIKTLLASWSAARLVDSSARAFVMLYLLPESIVQLADNDRQCEIAELPA